MSETAYQPGQRVLHPEFGEGIVVSATADGYVRVFFSTGERQLFRDAIRPAQSRTEQMLANVAGGEERE